jgi:hypothetical protein
VPLVGSLVVCCVVRWLVVVWPLEEVILLLLEMLKEEELVKLLEDMVVVVGFFGRWVVWLVIVVVVVVCGSRVWLEGDGESKGQVLPIYLGLEPRRLVLLRIEWNVLDLWPPPMMSLCDGVGECLVCSSRTTGASIT